MKTKRRASSPARRKPATKARKRRRSTPSLTRPVRRIARRFGIRL
jgi:hypothetical protein